MSTTLQYNTWRRRLVQTFWDFTIKQSPSFFLNYLHDKHHDLIVKSYNQTRYFNWSNIMLPDRLDGAESFAFLFWLTPLNRGLIRQDIDETFALYETIRLMRNPIGVEIGRFFGASTLLIAHAVGYGGRLHSIDIAPQDDNALGQVLQRYNLHDRVRLIIADANTVEIDGELDFAFIDGDHSYDGARKDHNRWAKRVRVGGYIIHHDMGNSRPFSTQWDTLKVLREHILDQQKGQLELVREAGSMAIFQRISADFKDITAR